MKLRHYSWFSAALLCGALILPAVGCGDDSDTTDTDAGAGSGGSTGGSGGKGGSGGSSKAGSGGKSGSGGKGGSGGSGAMLMCGGSACTPNATLLAIAPGTKACCTSDDKCGQTNSAGTCMQQNAPGELDSNCPTVDVDYMGMNYPQMGCCTAKGQCGGKFEQTGYGCTAREDLLKDMGGPLDHIACGSGALDDGGVEDAGM